MELKSQNLDSNVGKFEFGKFGEGAAVSLSSDNLKLVGAKFFFGEQSFH